MTGVLCLVAATTVAQEPVPAPAENAVALGDTAAAPADSAGHRSKVSAYPYAYYTPETEFAVGGGGIWTFYVAEDALLRPSRVAFSGYVSTTGQYQLTLEPGVYFSSNRNYARMKLFFGHYVDRFYGVGNDSPDLGVEEYGSERYGLEMELQVPPLLFGQDRTGIIVDLQNFNVIDTKENPYLRDESLTGINGGVVVGVGFNFVEDSRDNTFFPTTGIYGQTKAIFYSRTLGSDFTFQNLDIDMRRYLPIGDRVLGVNVRLNMVGGDPPFFRLPALGGQRLMRGFYEGRYRDKVYTAAQVEYRRYFRPRWGFVAFLSTGEVAASISDVKLDELRLAGGAGLRFLINPDEKVNVRADFGIGKDTNGVYFGIEEAF
jgi:outer membrane protein assembly factor BamA